MTFATSFRWCDLVSAKSTHASKLFAAARERMRLANLATMTRFCIAFSTHSFQESNERASERFISLPNACRAFACIRSSSLRFAIFARTRSFHPWKRRIFAPRCIVATTRRSRDRFSELCLAYSAHLWYVLETFILRHRCTNLLTLYRFSRASDDHALHD